MEQTSRGSRVLVVEDETRLNRALLDLLGAWGYEADAATDGQDAIGKIDSFNPVVVISDLRMPRMGGMELLKQVKMSRPEIKFIMLTGQGSIEEAVEATKLGAFNFIEKPLDAKRLQVELRNCLERHEGERELEVARRQLRNAGILGSLVGRSKAMQKVLTLIEQVAPSVASVLIVGESGTGKEMAARTLHQLSPRAKHPFVAVNCAAIPETLMESEIFGHEKGAFTGALERRAGCFELADRGTLLLDEVGEMPMATQAKLLRVLEDSKVRRLGSKGEVAVDVRVLAATNKVPEEAMAGGQLRSDLFYRLNVVQIRMPALRDHLEDLEDLVATLLDDLNRKHNREIRGVDEEVMDAFRHHAWPGNCRELRNVLERAVIVAEPGLLHLKDLPSGFGGQNESGEPPRLRPGMTVDEAERHLILETLGFTANNKTRAAEMLGISLKTLHNKLKSYESGSQN